MGEPARDRFEALLVAARRAPSGDNTQPWRFVVNPEAGRIALQVDEQRDLSPMNAGQRMSRIAVGAALENLVRMARRHGWAVELGPGRGPDRAVVHLVGGPAGPIEADEPIVARVTNRRTYDRRPIAPEVLDALGRETPVLEGVRTHWIVDRGRLASLARLIGRADALMFGDASMRRAFLANVRFDAPPDATVEEGLSLASLELSAADRVALRLMRRIPDWLLKVGGAARVFAAKARGLVESASGLCLVVARDGSEPTDLLVGRAMQRAWLALTARGMAVQPMMSLLVLDNALEHGRPALVAAFGRDRLTTLRDAFRALAPEIGAGRPAFLMRFGFAPEPSGRTARRPPQVVLEAEVVAGRVEDPGS